MRVSEDEKAALIVPVFGEHASTMNSSPGSHAFLNIPVIPFPNLPRAANGGM